METCVSAKLDEMFQRVVIRHTVEVWRAFHKGRFGSYEVSQLGNVRFVTNAGRVGDVTIHRTNEGLPRVKIKLMTNGVNKEVTHPIDEVVARSFLNPRNPCDILIHRDGDLLNNTYDNLRYLSQDEYMNYVWEIPKYPGVKWKAIRGFSRYLASDRGGMVMNGEFGYLMSQNYNEEGYAITAVVPDVKIHTKPVTKSVHLLIADSWLLDKPGKDYVDHINKHRSDNDVCNLRRVTCKENAENREYPKSVPKRCTRIQRIDPDTDKVLQTYNSLTDAGKWVKANTDTKDSKPRARFNKVANKDKTAFGFKWVYIDDNETIDGEVWKPIPLEMTRNKAGYYVSNYGRIKHPSERNISKGCLKSGYMVTSLGFGKDIGIHVIVAKVFLHNDDNLPMVEHGNSDKTDNRLENLFWSTHSANSQRAHDCGEINVKRCIEVVDTVTGITMMYESVKDAAATLGCHGATILRCHNKTVLYHKRYRVTYV